MVRRRLRKRLEKSWGYPEKEPEFETVNKRVTGAIDENQVRDYTKEETKEYESVLRKKLETAGLSPIVMDILILKFVYDLSFVQIAEELKIVDTSTAIRLYSEAREYLKTAGFR
jgi:hypothetical protein